MARYSYGLLWLNGPILLGSGMAQSGMVWYSWRNVITICAITIQAITIWGHTYAGHNYVYGQLKNAEILAAPHIGLGGWQTSWILHPSNT